MGNEVKSGEIEVVPARKNAIFAGLSGGSAPFDS